MVVVAPGCGEAGLEVNAGPELPFSCLSGAEGGGVEIEVIGELDWDGWEGETEGEESGESEDQTEEMHLEVEEFELKSLDAFDSWTSWRLCPL